MRQLTPRKQVARSCAPSSRTVKYQWPDAAVRKLEISPSTQTEAKRFSSAPRTCEVNSDTLSGRRSAASNSDMRRGRVMLLSVCESIHEKATDEERRNVVGQAQTRSRQKKRCPRNHTKRHEKNTNHVRRFSSRTRMRFACFSSCRFVWFRG